MDCGCTDIRLYTGKTCKKTCTERDVHIGKYVKSRDCQPCNDADERDCNGRPCPEPVFRSWLRKVGACVQLSACMPDLPAEEKEDT